MDNAVFVSSVRFVLNLLCRPNLSYNSSTAHPQQMEPVEFDRIRHAKTHAESTMHSAAECEHSTRNLYGTENDIRDEIVQPTRVAHETGL